MLKQLFPKLYQRYLSSPLLGPILDGYEDWLSGRKYTRKTRRLYMRMALLVDQYLQELGLENLADISADNMQDLWVRYHIDGPNARSLGGAIQTISACLDEKGLLRPASPKPSTPFDLYLDGYAAHLRDIRGFAPSTVHYHLATTAKLLTHLLGEGDAPRFAELDINAIEDFLTPLASGLARGTMQHEVAHIRSFLRYLAMMGVMPSGLDAQIDTPRAYRPRPPIRALPWGTVEAFLRSIDRKLPIGLRDYAMFLLMTHYGLRPSEIVDLTLDDIAWRKGEIRVVQRKTGQPLYLPLMDQVTTALVEYLHSRPLDLPYRQLFLRVRAPAGLLKPTAVTEAFQHWARLSGLAIPFQGSYCLRHSYAVHLLHLGISVKTIGDLLGHRVTESTEAYLRLSLEDLRGVALPLPKELSDE
jgi:site-specific recombinase XerD